MSGPFSSAKTDPMALLMVPPALLVFTQLAAYAPALRARSTPCSTNNVLLACVGRQ